VYKGGFKSISDIHLLFNNFSLDSNFLQVEMEDYFSPLDFSNVNGYPRVLPEKAIDKLPAFQGNNA
jgi:hypothetical protein